MVPSYTWKNHPWINNHPHSNNPSRDESPSHSSLKTSKESWSSINILYVYMEIVENTKSLFCDFANS